MKALAVKGMGGLGDAIHQRALVRAWLRDGYSQILMQTSHPELYWDFRESGQVRCTPLRPSLRTQRKNEQSACFDGNEPPASDVRVWYTPECIKRHNSLLKAMADYVKVQGATDIGLPIHPNWQTRAIDLVDRLKITKPLLIYRPPVLRREWLGPARNPDPLAMLELLNAVRESFYVISIADLVPNVEWIDGPDPVADASFHAGELHFTTLAALMARPGTVVMSPPGFALCMGRAVGAWTCGVFGSFELPGWWEFGTPKPERLITFAPARKIPDEELWKKELHCDKSIDLPAAIVRFKEFCAAARCDAGGLSDPVRMAEPANEPPAPSVPVA